MQIQITGHHVEVTSALRTFTEEKFSKLERHFDKITAINICLEVAKQRQIAEASVLIAKAELHARVEADDMYSAIEALVDKLDRQLLKHKEKLHKHRE